MIRMLTFAIAVLIGLQYPLIMEVTMKEHILQNQFNPAAGDDHGSITEILQSLLRDGFKGIMRTFKTMDDDDSRSLDFAEFKIGIQEAFKLEFEYAQVQEAFAEFDNDESGTIDFDEFLKALRPPMSQARKNLVNQAFDKLDKTGDGNITVEDLRDVYNVKKQPQCGKGTEDECLRQLLDTFDSPNDTDGVVTRDEFLTYYSGVSASIKSDDYFKLLMKTTWSL